MTVSELMKRDYSGLTESLQHEYQARDVEFLAGGIPGFYRVLYIDIDEHTNRTKTISEKDILGIYLRYQFLVGYYGELVQS